MTTTTTIQTLPARRQGATISPWLLALTSVIGLGAFFYPFVLPPDRGGETAAHAADTPLLLALLVGLAVLILLADLETRRLDTKQIALLGILIATNTALRPLPGPGGLSPFYILPILGGYVYGAHFGFLLGALSMLTSALFTAGVGVWLPFQMFSMGWVGLISGWLGRPGQALARHGLAERWTLAAWGAVVGMGFGALMNLYSWPYIAPAQVADPGQAWDPAGGVSGALRSYLLYYLVTSFWYDLLRAAGNVALLLVLSAPLLRLLRRFQARFLYTVTSNE
jgi:energy-coupling factor transport system substrate-specific component